MTTSREAIALPGIFLTVFLLGGMQLEGRVAVLPPSLFALVLAMLLFAALIQSGTIAAERLVGAHRTSVANLNGLTVLITCFAASAQSLSLLIPASGLPAVAVALILLLLLLQVVAIAPDRLRLARGLLVTFGAIFTLKFIVLAAISGPSATRVGRAVQMLFDAATLGTLTQPPLHAASGYLAFATLLLYLIGVTLLPHADWTTVRVFKGAGVRYQESLPETLPTDDDL